MAIEDDKDLSKETEEQKQLYRKVRVPHKFCPNCGHRNPAPVDNCENCGKDISWIKVPEPVPHDTLPQWKPQSLPESRQPFKLWVVILIIAIIVLIGAAIAIGIWASQRNSETEQPQKSWEVKSPAVACLPVPVAVESRSPAGPPP